jgi:hypothetical protein
LKKQKALYKVYAIIIVGVVSCIVGVILWKVGTSYTKDNTPISALEMTDAERDAFDSKAIKNGIESVLSAPSISCPSQRLILIMIMIMIMIGLLFIQTLINQINILRM